MISPTPTDADRPPARTRRPLTLRTKLIAGIVALIIGLSAGIGIVTEIFASHYLTAQLDARIGNFQDRGPFGGGSGGGSTGGTSRPVAPTDGTGDPNSATSCTTISGIRGGSQVDALFACVQGGAVQQLYVWHNFTRETVDISTASVLAGLQAGAKPVTVTIPGLGDYRVAARTTSGGLLLVNGQSTEEVHSIQVRLAVIMTLVAGAAVILGAGLVFWLVRRSVRPLERVASTARKVSTLPLDKGEVDLSVRVPDRDTDTRTEIGQVGAALNQMLGHVSGALEARHASETRVRQFVADASHELRTPLAAIRGYAELARRGEHDPGAVSHALRRVESESSRMTTLVEDLLLLARLDSGRPLASEEVDLTMLVIDRVSDARVAGPEHRWRLDIPDEPVTVTGDTARLHQVLANLLTNARNHTPPGTSVVTGLREAPDGVVLTVTDDGPGIPADLQPEIFGRFVRGDSSRSRAAGSTGLGLAIVAAVIAAHGGTVTVDSRPGRTVARVWLPANAAPSTESSQPHPVSASKG